MKGLVYAFTGGALITLQGVANSRIGSDMGTWQAAALTQLTGFLAALLLMLALTGKPDFAPLRQVKPLYLGGGALASVIIFSNITAIHHVGATLSVSAVLIAQLGITFLVDGRGWFGIGKKQMHLPQFLAV
ncbi:DMT family transporter [Paenibacillus sp. YN15]|uniref:DMT family transporter n=1 Tax=Paenibacillus sp. YN15 TaxID=1742774 RepID=UPI000DCC24A9|nr:DMT family transporter [Paenibacillus sp. YN15]RAU93453.1 EamA-like transporter family protein [Paenibacillus sp. YN15]